MTEKETEKQKKESKWIYIAKIILDLNKRIKTDEYYKAFLNILPTIKEILEEYYDKIKDFVKLKILVNTKYQVTITNARQIKLEIGQSRKKGKIVCVLNDKQNFRSSTRDNPLLKFKTELLDKAAEEQAKIEFEKYQKLKREQARILLEKQKAENRKKKEEERRKKEAELKAKKILKSLMDELDECSQLLDDLNPEIQEARSQPNSNTLKNTKVKLPKISNTMILINPVSSQMITSSIDAHRKQEKTLLSGLEELSKLHEIAQKSMNSFGVNRSLSEPKLDNTIPISTITSFTSTSQSGYWSVILDASVQSDRTSQRINLMREEYGLLKKQ